MPEANLSNGDYSSKPRYSFLDDYGEGAHPDVLEALVASNGTQEAGYGKDRYSAEARAHIRRHLGDDAGDVGIFFVPGGTSANAISIAACLRPHEAVIATSSAHIVTRETGAVEATGHKIINAPPVNGKLTPDAIVKALDENWHYPHMARPRLVYISNATEIGTVYSAQELRALRRLCDERRLLLFMDGARLGAALTSPVNDVSLPDVLRLTDIFWIGGTKNGALLGEAVVVKDPSLALDYDFYVKQHGSLLAKSRVMGVEFAQLFRDKLYFDLARDANAAAHKLSRAVLGAGFALHAPTETNQVFAVVPLALIKMLQHHFLFYLWEKHDAGCGVIRLLTTWATEPAQVEKFNKMVLAWTPEQNGF
ncbi:hypothetical protein CDD82_5519 [Ophiocordyceps australis]|uniref:Aromatic amino acid beta-eliminating lyase/threonine aldolase domain-containing protein n=1 Tax=Ophiocordyceps australis TaxID=1399860 RepID=A0A2C5ZT37_9HYPO|nr:hypothetical protein CDD82_5519 [Ophiocordyceps australis]